MMIFLIHWLGFYVIWEAIQIGRPRESKLHLSQRETWIAVLLIIIGTTFVKFN